MDSGWEHSAVGAAREGLVVTGSGPGSHGAGSAPVLKDNSVAELTDMRVELDACLPASRGCLCCVAKRIAPTH